MPKYVQASGKKGREWPSFYERVLYIFNLTGHFVFTFAKSGHRFVICLFRFEDKSLTVVQASLKFDVAKDNLRLLTLLPPSLSAKTVGVCHHTWLTQGWGWSPGLCECQAITVPTEMHPAPWQA